MPRSQLPAELGIPLSLPQRSTTITAQRFAATLWPAAGSIALVWAAFFAASPLNDVGSASALPGVVLSQPPSYLLGAPLFGVLDAMTVMTLRQHYAFMLTVVLGVTAGIIAMRARSNASVASHFWIAARAMAIAVTALAAIYLTALLLWRPMAALRVVHPDDVIVDFHSHTAASHDGRVGFDAERNREWHRAGGFHVAYVTDHRSFVGVRAAALRNPIHSGDTTVLLGGLEIVADGHHLNLLGVAPRDSVFYPNGEYDHATHRARASASDVPLAVLAIPSSLGRLPRNVPLAAVELSDAAPRGISFGLRRRQHLLRIADSLNLAVVAGSDNHGWGRTVAGWSVMHLPGWRRLSPHALDAAIRNAIRERGRHAVQVIERRAIGTMGGDGALLTALTVPRMLWTMATGLTPKERCSWLVWLWAFHLLRRSREKRRQPVLRARTSRPQEVTASRGVSRRLAQGASERLSLGTPNT